ncbi:MAG TPA: DUF6084 family protein [Thermoanaerobaculia bacterium]|jgi:hypothetical protein|nr:DUF6084 family protein [Thermoanaerobaculia bacterium]
MADLKFQVAGARAEPYAAVPTLVFTLRIEEVSSQPIHAIALRCQVQIEPNRRSHSPAEQARLLEMFGVPGRWGETVKPLHWTHVSVMVPSFQGAVTVDLPMTCTYDFEVTAAKYFEALDDGEIPLLFLFSGTVFTPGGTGFMVQRVPWEKEAPFRLPVRVWRQVMDLYFPHSVWIRLQRESLDALQRFKAERALPTWDDVVAALLANVPLSEVSS